MYTKGKWIAGDAEVNVIINGVASTICECFDHHGIGRMNSAANVERIVHCVNNFDALVEALEGLLNEAHSASKPLHQDSEWSIKSRKALALAKGDQP